MKKGAGTLAGMILLAVTGLAGCGKQEVTLISNQIETELGAELDTTVTNYVKLGEKDVEKASVDFSTVDIMTAGTYKANVIYEDTVIPFEVVVKDTTAPVVEVNENIIIAVGEPLYTKDVITSITELSGEVTISFQKPEPLGEDVPEGTQAVSGTEVVNDTEAVLMSQQEEITEAGSFTLDDVTFLNAYVIYDRIGEYDNIMTVADASGNKVEVPVHIVVGDAPVLEGAEDITVTAGSDSVDYLDGVKAVDSNGVDITDRIVCNTEAVDLNKEGTYTITYAVTDTNGFKAALTSTVTVNKEDAGKTNTVKKTPGSGKNNAVSTTGGKKAGTSDLKETSGGQTDSNKINDTGNGGSNNGNSTSNSGNGGNNNGSGTGNNSTNGNNNGSSGTNTGGDSSSSGNGGSSNSGNGGSTSGGDTSGNINAGNNSQTPSTDSGNNGTSDLPFFDPAASGGHLSPGDYQDADGNKVTVLPDDPPEESGTITDGGWDPDSPFAPGE